MSSKKQICRDCRSPMNEGAAKCTSCGSFQNWRRHFTFTATVVSFFLGGVATAGIIIDPVKEWLTPLTDVSVERVGVTAKGYTVIVHNKGRATAVIKYINVFYGENLDFLQDSIEDRIIEAGESRYFNLTWPQGALQPTYDELDFSRNDPVDGPRQRCELLFSIFAGEEVWKTIDERYSDGSCNGDIVDFVTGQQSVG